MASERDVDFDKNFMEHQRGSVASRLALVVVSAGICVLLLPLAMLVSGEGRQRELERQWRESFEAARVGEIVPIPARRAGVERFALTRLTIPKIGVNAIIVDGVTPAALRRGPGHFPSTASPGENGNCCVAGHRNVYGSWFRRLDRLLPGDEVFLSSPDGRFLYTVSETSAVEPTDIHVLKETVEPVLTLVTCAPIPRPSQRLVVVARLQRSWPAARPELRLYGSPGWRACKEGRLNGDTASGKAGMERLPGGVQRPQPDAPRHD